EIGLEQTRTCSPNVEISVAAGLEQKEDANEKTDEHQGQGRGFCTAVGRREGDARRDHRPVRRAVEARAPDSAAVDFASVEMGECLAPKHTTPLHGPVRLTSSTACARQPNSRAGACLRQTRGPPRG